MRPLQVTENQKLKHTVLYAEISIGDALGSLEWGLGGKKLMVAIVLHSN